MADARLRVLWRSNCWLRSWIGVREEEDIREGPDCETNHLLSSRESTLPEGERIHLL